MIRTRSALSFVIALPLVAACGDSTKDAEVSATREVERLSGIVKQDADEVRSGLPAGAKKLGGVLAPDFANDLPGLQRAIGGARASVDKLSVAKSTFFSFADTTGTVLRSEADPDMLAGKNLFAAFPGLKKALDAGSGNVEAYGEMQELRGVRKGQDTAWVVAHPVVSKEQKVLGLFVTGWSYRRYAYHLEEVAKRDLADEAQKQERKLTPIAYVFVVAGDKAYGAPVTPDVDAQAVEGLHVVAATEKGPFKGSVEVTGRRFAVSAARAPELGKDAAIAVMLSPI